jgi:hypothetical protein
MSKQQIKDIYDTNYNLTLEQLSNMTGYTVSELIDILMEG